MALRVAEGSGRSEALNLRRGGAVASGAVVPAIGTGLASVVGESTAADMTEV